MSDVVMSDVVMSDVVMGDVVMGDVVGDVMGMLCSPRTLSHGGKSPHRSLPSNTETCYGFCAGPEGKGP
jgi:hypothetical protein